MPPVPMSLVVMLCHARSGGTLLNRCLGALPGVVVLSELNPLGGGAGREGPRSASTVREQARRWYGIEVRSDVFADGVVEVHAACQRSSRRLVLRDWSTINFSPCRQNRGTPPNRFLTLDALRDRVEAVPFAFVRDAIDVWLSMGRPSLSEMFPPYLEYARAVSGGGWPVFRYEDFCRDPGAELRRLCEATGLPFGEAWRDWERFETVNGDVQVRGGSRGRRQRAIRPLPRRRLEAAAIAALEGCPEMVEANRLLGYPTRYDAVPLESRLAAALERPTRLLRRLMSR